MKDEDKSKDHPERAGQKAKIEETTIVVYKPFPHIP